MPSRSWAYSKVVWKSSKTYETARFLLDHPRRCFIYMFPARQTWLLFTILTAITWVAAVEFEVRMLMLAFRVQYHRLGVLLNVQYR